MVGYRSLVSILMLVMGADLCAMDSNEPMPSSEETQAEREHWEAEAEVIRQEGRGDPWSLSTSVRALELEKQPAWRMSLKTDIPHPLVSRALHMESVARMQGLIWKRASAARLRDNEDQLARLEIFFASERITALLEVERTAISIEERVKAAVADGAATRDDGLGAAEARSAATLDFTHAQDESRALIESYRIRFSKEPAVPVPCDVSLMNLSDQNLIQRAAASDAALNEADYEAQALAARTSMASGLLWTCPSSIEAIVDFPESGEDGFRNSHEYSYGIQATFQLTSKDNGNIAVAEEAAAVAAKRIAYEYISREVRCAAIKVRSAYATWKSTENRYAELKVLVTESEEAAKAEQSLVKRRDSLAMRLAQAQVKVVESHYAYQYTLLTLAHMIAENPLPAANSR